MYRTILRYFHIHRSRWGFDHTSLSSTNWSQLRFSLLGSASCFVCASNSPQKKWIFVATHFGFSAISFLSFFWRLQINGLCLSQIIETKKQQQQQQDMLLAASTHFLITVPTSPSHNHTKKSYRLHSHTTTSSKSNQVSDSKSTSIIINDQSRTWVFSVWHFHKHR